MIGFSLFLVTWPICWRSRDEETSEAKNWSVLPERAEWVPDVLSDDISSDDVKSDDIWYVISTIVNECPKDLITRQAGNASNLADEGSSPATTRSHVGLMTLISFVTGPPIQIAERIGLTSYKLTHLTRWRLGKTDIDQKGRRQQVIRKKVSCWSLGSIFFISEACADVYSQFAGIASSAFYATNCWLVGFRKPSVRNQFLETN